MYLFLGLKGTFLEAKILTLKVFLGLILTSIGVPFRPTTVQIQNLALIETKPIAIRQTLVREIE